MTYPYHIGLIRNTNVAPPAGTGWNTTKSSTKARRTDD